jgi:hypothetical protein
VAGRLSELNALIEAGLGRQRGMIWLLPVLYIRDALSRRNFALLSKVLNGTVEKSQI